MRKITITWYFVHYRHTGPNRVVVHPDLLDQNPEDPVIKAIKKNAHPWISTCDITDTVIYQAWTKDAVVDEEQSPDDGPFGNLGITRVRAVPVGDIVIATYFVESDN
jgi:hypothetical protein